MSDETTPKHPTIQEDHLISMIDGKPYRLLLLHVKKNGYTRQSYCEAFNLPADYPMVAPSLSRSRSELSRQIDHTNQWNRHRDERRSEQDPAVEGAK